MPCLLGCLALFIPRVVLLALAIFTDYLEEAYETILWPVLGFVFLPLTTLAYAYAVNSTGGNVRGIYLVLVVVAVLLDLGLIGSGEASRRRRRS